MPYKSLAQKARCHKLLAEGKLTKEQVAQWDKESEGLDLPHRVTQKKMSKVTEAWVRKNKPWMLNKP